MTTLDDSPMEKMSDDLSACGGGASSAPVTVFDYDDGPDERAPDGRWGNRRLVQTAN